MDYTITDSFVLPSQGKIYSTEIDPNVTLRTMTTAEEMRRMSQTDYPYRVMSDIIKACMVDGPKLSPYDMCIGDYLFLLYKLRLVTYGSEYSLSSTCPYCMHVNNDTIDLKDLLVLEYKDDIMNFASFDLPQTKQHVEIKFQTPRMLDTIAEKGREFNKKTKDKSIDPNMLYTLSTMIKTVDGDVPDPILIDEWVRQLPMLDTQTILAYADRLNNSIGLQRVLDVECDICGLMYSSSFRLNNEFFRPTIHI